MYGFASVIDVLTGLVVDYVVLSKFAMHVVLKKLSLGIILTNLQNGIRVTRNNVPSTISEDQHDLRYTFFWGDGDSKAHKDVCDLDIYPEPILKENVSTMYTKEWVQH